ncbi:hypothetical protein [Clostridium guangxiense]|uniref:hypothetical protein n=1 Tax=Clostridium guangxiense TaxID=1662055 RepID=UPI001E4C50D5|nr:hypothetical protein [Clostridium guangxiense]MCD2345797.1 hypothetical protein [Clostridium guangxiense]
MKENIFKKTEYALYNYKNLEIKIKNIEIDIENLKNDYTGITAISYEEKSSPTFKFNSSVENEVVKKEKLIKQLEGVKEYNLNLKRKIDNALKCLTSESYKLVELRYFTQPKKTWVAIGNEIKMDKDYCCKKRCEIINKLAELIYSY